MARDSYSLLTHVVFVTLAGLSFGCARLFGATGFMVPLEAFAACWAVASVCGIKQIFGRRIKELTITEIIVVASVLSILHGLLMPAMQSRGHQRRVPPTVPPVIQQTPFAPVNDESGEHSPI